MTLTKNDGPAPSRVETIGKALLKGLQWLCVGVIAAVLFGIVARFSEDATEDWGLYDNAGAKVQDALSWFAGFVFSPWFLLPAFWIIAFTAGYWLRALLHSRGVVSGPGISNGPSTVSTTTTTPAIAHQLAAPASPLSPPMPEKLSALVADMVRSPRDDFDMIAVDLIVRGVRSDDGINISAILHYRNRSRKHVSVQSISTIFEIGGKAPPGKLSTGVNGVTDPEKTESLRFLPVRVYKDKPVNGIAHFSFMFGESKETMRTVLSISYAFTIVSFPADKSTDMPLKLDPINPVIEYYVRETD